MALSRQRMSSGGFVRTAGAGSGARHSESALKVQAAGQRDRGLASAVAGPGEAAGFGAGSGSGRARRDSKSSYLQAHDTFHGFDSISGVECFENNRCRYNSEDNNKQKKEKKRKRKLKLPNFIENLIITTAVAKSNFERQTRNPPLQPLRMTQRPEKTTQTVGTVKVSGNYHQPLSAGNIRIVHPQGIICFGNNRCRSIRTDLAKDRKKKKKLKLPGFLEDILKKSNDNRIHNTQTTFKAISALLAETRQTSALYRFQTTTFDILSFLKSTTDAGKKLTSEFSWESVLTSPKDIITTKPSTGSGTQGVVKTTSSKPNTKLSSSKMTPKTSESATNPTSEHVNTTPKKPLTCSSEKVCSTFYSTIISLKLCKL